MRPNRSFRQIQYQNIHTYRCLCVCLVILALLASCSNPTPTTQFTQPAPSVVAPMPSKTLTLVPATPSQAPRATVTPNTLIHLNPAILRGTSVQLWNAFSGDSGETFQQLVDQFNVENKFGIHIIAIYQGNYNDLYEKVDEITSSSDFPDITVANLYQILTWKDKGKNIVDLQPYINDSTWGLNQQEQADYYPNFWGNEDVSGMRLAIPAQRTAALMAYNQSWARELGFESPPATSEEFKVQACAAGRMNSKDSLSGNDGTGGWVTNTAPVTMLSWMYAYGAQIVNPTGSGYQFNTLQVKTAFTYLKSLYDAGCAWQAKNETSTGGEGEGEHAEMEFATRQALFISLSLTDIPYLEKTLERVGNKDQWTVIAFPSTIKPAITVSGPSYVLFNSSPEKQLAGWIFLKWFSSPQNQARWITTNGTFPLQSTTLDLLDNYAASHPQWLAAIQLLPYGRSEPTLASWSLVRWVVSDVGTQIFRYYFTADRIPATLKLMDETAEEILKYSP